MSLLTLLRRLRLMKPRREPEAPTMVFLRDQREESALAQTQIATGNWFGDVLADRPRPVAVRQDPRR